MNRITSYNVCYTKLLRLRVAHLGTSSVRYEIGLFVLGENEACAGGYFVHVFVDRNSRRPVPIPDTIRAALTRLQVSVITSYSIHYTKLYEMQQPSSTYLAKADSGSGQHGVQTQRPLASAQTMPVITPERTLDNLTTAVLVTDTNRRLRFINPAGEMLLQLGASKARNNFV